MHTVVVRKELAVAHPGIVSAIYASFCDAGAAAARQPVQGMAFNNMGVMVPWLTRRIEQGLTRRRFEVEDIFVPYLPDI